LLHAFINCFMIPMNHTIYIWSSVKPESLMLSMPKKSSQKSSLITNLNHNIGLSDITNREWEG